MPLHPPALSLSRRSLAAPLIARFRPGPRGATAMLLSLSALVAIPAQAQQGYRQPPPAIAAILDAPQTPIVSTSPNNSVLLLSERSGYPSIAEVAAPEYKLAGMRFDPRSNGPSRGSGSRSLSLLPVTDGDVRRISIPWPSGTDTMSGPISNTRWNASGDRIFFTVTTDDAIYPFVADVATATARQLSNRPLNGVLGAPCSWIGREPALICKFIPNGRGSAPKEPTTPDGPIIQETEGGSADRVATYQDLLKSPYDEAVFHHYATSQLARLSLEGVMAEVGAPGIHASSAPSPDGRYVLVTTMARPFSYVVPANYFPTTIAVWDANGREVRKVNELPLRERVPWGGDVVAEGPRSIRWRSDSDATLVWSEAPRGDTTAVDGVRDRVQMLAAPFAGDPVTLVATEFRTQGVQWAKPTLAIVREGWQRTRTERLWAIDPTKPGTKPRMLWERNTEDRYADPGSFMMTTNDAGESVLNLTPDGRYAFLQGDGASDEGDRPFVDRYELSTGKKTRLFQSAPGVYERAIELLNANGDRMLTQRESKTEVPNYWVRETRARSAPRQLTNFTDPAPQLAGVTSELITYKRKDGVQLSGTLYLPAGYDKTRDGPLPFLLWAYPREFRSAAAAAQVQGSPYRFVRPGGTSHLFVLTQGYGVLDGPAMPIIGEGDAEPNDTYVEQLVSSAEAAVNAIVDLGVADRDRIGVGGHSYGAFMTANLLAHSRLFRAGLARSGAYNRTLTPFGFQAEQRSYWQAQEIYTNMSPFTYADRIKDPILLVHGMADNNTGTFPVQSERMYAALKGNGATVRYVQLPAESHGYSARESIGHTLFEMISWLDKHVKPKRPTATMQQ